MTGTKTIELRVNGRVIETRPFSEMTVEVIQGLGKLDSKNEFYELNKAIHILKSCLVDPADWEVFAGMSMTEFNETLSEWTELQGGTEF
jgi:hypothetical protein